MSTKFVPKPATIINLASFYYWLSSLPRARALDSLIRGTYLRSHAIAGFEIPLTIDGHDSIKMTGFEILGDDFLAAVLSAPIRTAHLPELKHLSPRDAHRCGAALAEFAKRYNISEFTAHPDEVSPCIWDGLLCGLKGVAPVSVENMDIRKKYGVELRELAQLLTDFPSLTFTFDLCHWLERGYSDNDPQLLSFLNNFSNRLTKLHFSCPKSQAEIYRNGIEIQTNHYLVAGSNYIPSEEFLGTLSTEIAWVIEGVIPYGASEALAEEVLLIRELQDAQQGLKTVA